MGKSNTKITKQMWIVIVVSPRNKERREKQYKYNKTDINRYRSQSQEKEREKKQYKNKSNMDCYRESKGIAKHRKTPQHAMKIVI